MNKCGPCHHGTRLEETCPECTAEIVQLKADKAELVAALNGLFLAFPLPVGPDREDYEIARNRIAKHTPKL